MGREKALNNNKILKARKTVIYLMSRDQRVEDNHALILAYKKSLEHKLPLVVIFHLNTKVSPFNFWHYDFMLKGLKEVYFKLRNLNINFVFSVNKSKIRTINLFNPAIVILDFSPLKNAKNFSLKLSKENYPVILVDTHNIVPVWETSDKEEWGAYTIRGKIAKLLDNYLEKPETVLKKLPFKFNFEAFKNLIKEKIFVNPTENDWKSFYRNIKAEKVINYSYPYKPTFNEALKVLYIFLEKKLKNYSVSRNNPLYDGQSNLSAYLHFGQISSLTVVLKLIKTFNISDVEQYFKKNLKRSILEESIANFLDEIIIRKELSDNFCYYNDNYNNFDGLKPWSKETLNLHKNDKREYIYSLEELEHGKTHDQIWNSTQKEMTFTGKMHGFLRMYWAKKILEWSSSPEEAIKTAIYLNDKYEMDGRDPNGYTGILWSIGGIHDHPWNERKIFGKIRYMSESGLKKRFDLNLYISKFA